VKLQPVRNTDLYLFTGHGEGYVSINGKQHTRPLAVMGRTLQVNWLDGALNTLEESHFDCLLQLSPEIVLLGTGARQHFVHPGLYRKLTAAGIGVECMDTAAVCRTYNILIAEDRKVVAAVLMR